jgi:hypothetical protein
MTLSLKLARLAETFFATSIVLGDMWVVVANCQSASVR